MFVRKVAIRLKPSSLAEFTQTFDNEVAAILRKQTGFQSEITFSTSSTGMDLVAISLWDTEEHAEAYNMAGYFEVLKSLSKVLDGPPEVLVSDVISSTIQPPLLPHKS